MEKKRDEWEKTLEIKDLVIHYTSDSETVYAVNGIDMEISKGKTLGLVGETGAGKTTTALSILNLIPEPSGKIISGEVKVKGKDVLQMGTQELRSLRGDQVAMIFQDLFSSLNPRKTVAETIEEPLILSKMIPDKEKRFIRVLELMDRVGLAERLVNTYPHELDGGRRQRIGIARALALDPKFIVCDEPVSTLDVSIQAQILNLMKKIQKEMGITHDLSVVNHFSDDIAVMYLGRLVEKAPAEELFQSPLHPYTKALLSAIPVPRIHNRPERMLLKGEITSPVNPKPICRFANRCSCAKEICSSEEPELLEVSPGHFVACHCCK